MFEVVADRARLSGRLNLDYEASKYLAQFSFRCDGFSKFGKKNQYGNFFTFSGGWVASNEAFVKDIEWINNLKLRASYGSLGNTPPARYPHLGLYNVKYQYNGNPGAFPHQLDNQILTWEKCYTSNFAIDLSIVRKLSEIGN